VYFAAISRSLRDLVTVVFRHFGHGKLTLPAVFATLLPRLDFAMNITCPPGSAGCF
jgi:hypothetical protein